VHRWESLVALALTREVLVALIGSLRMRGGHGNHKMERWSAGHSRGVARLQVPCRLRGRVERQEIQGSSCEHRLSLWPFEWTVMWHAPRLAWSSCCIRLTCLETSFRCGQGLRLRL